MNSKTTAEALSPQVQAVLARIEAKRDEVVALTQDLVRIPTVNPPGDAYEACARFNQGFPRNDAGGPTAFQVASATAINFAVAKFCTKGVGGPSAARFHHIDMAVEVHALATARTLPTRHHIDARLGI